MNKRWEFLVPLVPVLILLPIWESLVRNGFIEPYLLPAPSAIWKCLLNDRELLTGALTHTAQCSLIGILLTLVFGVCAGFLLSLSPIMKAMFYPFALIFQTVPIISIAPLLVIWFGYGKPSVIASSFIVSFFPMLAAAVDAFSATQSSFEELFKIYDASFFKLWTKLKIPASLPQLLTGFKISTGLAIIGSVVGEFISGQGLGSVVDVAKIQYRSDLMFAAILLATILGVASFYFSEICARILIGKWHPSKK